MSSKDKHIGSDPGDAQGDEGGEILHRTRKNSRELIAHQVANQQQKLHRNVRGKVRVKSSYMCVRCVAAPRPSGSLPVN